MTHSSPTYKQQLATALLEKASRSNGLTTPPAEEPTAPANRPSIDLLMWTMLNRPFLDPGNAFDLSHHLYLIDIYGCMAADMVIMKAGQVGISEYAVSRAFWTCDVLRGNVMYVMPTDADVSDFSQMRFNPALNASPYLDSLVAGTDRVGMKQVRSNFIVFRGGKVDKGGGARQLKSVPADLVILDELDEMDPRAEEIADKRLGHSDLKHKVKLSTPSYPGFGIQPAWVASDQREWFVPCPHCGRKQQLLIDQVVEEWDDLERPVHWRGIEEERAWVSCERCGKELDRLARGEWVPTYPDREVVGFRPTKLFTATNSILSIVKNLSTTDETKRKEAFNQDLALAYTPRGGQLTDEELDKCKRDYPMGPPVYEKGQRQIAAFGGVDVGSKLHTVIRLEPDPVTRERKLVLAEEFDSFSQVKAAFDRYNVRAAVVDALPETRSARGFQADMPAGVVWLAYYSVTSTGLKTEEPIQWNYKDKLVNLDRTRTLDSMYARVFDQSNVLPPGIAAVKNYYPQMKAPVRILRDGPAGEQVALYVEASADHFAHAENYCYVASTKSLGWARGA